ncbi:hypothetical protein GLA29479_2896 [Lysobacter antibioticus]|nr:hypothetical protein GLA29479_2896 [Lysobacter antibioticus]
MSLAAPMIPAAASKASAPHWLAQRGPAVPRGAGLLGIGAQAVGEAAV